MKEIILTQGQIALVDDEDFEWLNQWKWYARRTKYLFYAQRNSSTVNGKRYLILMHSVIIGKPPRGLETDHRDGNGLNNQRDNLRHVTLRQNRQNLHCKKTSQYPGVVWCKQKKKWIAHIQINKKSKHLGQFDIEKEAFEVYCHAIEELGEKMLEGAKI